MNSNPNLLLLSGPVGVGKSSVGEELGEVLIERQVPHTFIDLDHLRYTHPKPNGDRWGMQLGLKNLASVWDNCWQSGARNLIVATVVENDDFIAQIQQVLPNMSVKVIQLSASADTLEQRVRKREIGSGLQWHINRAHELAQILSTAPADFRLATDGLELVDIANRCADLIDWQLV